MTRNVLLVEDDENDVFFFTRAMKSAGWTDPLQVVRDGKQAVDFLSGAGQFSGRDEFPLPALILLDVKLPYVNGLEVLKWIREQSIQVAVVMFTSSREEWTWKALVNSAQTLTSLNLAPRKNCLMS